MAAKKNIEEKLQSLADAFDSDENIVENVMHRIDQLAAAEPKKQSKNNLLVRRFIMNRFTKLAAAAVIIIAVTLSITLFDKSIPAAYALEQTIQASHSVYYLHIKAFDPSQQEPTEVWAEFDGAGQVKNVRLYMPEWTSIYDGPKLIVWKEGKAQIWLEKKNVLGIVADETIANHILKTVEELDPKLAVNRLYETYKKSKL